MNKKVIAVVDDDADFCESLANDIQEIVSGQYEVRPYAENISNAISEINTDKEIIDLIFLDVMIHGYRKDEFLDEMDESLVEKTIMISTYPSDMEELRIKKKIPGNRTLPKPVEYETVQAVLKANKII